MSLFSELLPTLEHSLSNSLYCHQMLKMQFSIQLMETWGPMASFQTVLLEVNAWGSTQNSAAEQSLVGPGQTNRGGYSQA